jgi:hypothetical protein
VPTFIGVENFCHFSLFIQNKKIPWTIPITDSTAVTFCLVNNGRHSSTPYPPSQKTTGLPVDEYE